MKQKLSGDKSLQKGQVLLVVLLIAMVVLTIGLSVVSRSVTEIRISSQAQESARAFWVAQTGLEKALKAQSGLTGTVGDITYQVSKTSIGVGQSYFFCDKMSADDSYPVWLVGHTAAGEVDSGASYPGNSLTLYWGSPGTPADSDTTPAVEPILIYRDASGVFRSYRFPFDPNQGRSVKTGFTAPEVGSFVLGSSTFAFRGRINNLTSLPGYSKPFLLNVRLFFSGTAQPFGIQGDANLPDQGSRFESTATITSSQITRKLSECSPWTNVSDIFDYLLFSGGALRQ